VTLVTGVRLGPYEILAPLGAGGMGEVYRAKDTNLGREVAIKALPAAFASDPERLSRFRREAQTLASLNHPNIASIYGLESDAGTPHLVLELVEGETLASRLEHGPLPLRESLQVGLQVAAAMEAAHERGVVHRDLKPGNIMITTSGVAKVLDFGLAKSAGDPGGSTDSEGSPTVTAGATAAGAILGTTSYMSPEQARGKAVDRRSDVWSFGCVLFECLSGSQPFPGETASDIIAKILEREPDWAALPVGTPARVRDVLRRCLRRDAEARPRDIRDVRLELAEIAIGPQAVEPSRGKSVAVLPFENQGGRDDEFFADGMTDEILNALAQIDGLRVAGRTSCFAFKGRREDLRAIGEKLDVATLLEGTVRRSGSRLRITVQLVSSADGYQLWSQRYDRELTDVFEVQDEIAGAVAGRLAVTLGGPSPDETSPAPMRRGTASVEAYELFLKGRALQYQRGTSIAEAIGCFERAIALDPSYGEALAWLADSYRLMGTYGVRPSSEVMPRAREAAERALALDPELAEARAALADVEAQYDRDLGKASASWERALASDPRHVRSRCERALWSNAFGAMDVEEAVVETALAVADDPLNAWVVGMHSWSLAYAGRSGEAVAEAERAAQLDPGSFFARWNLQRALGFDGQYDRAIGLAPGLLALQGRNPWAMGTLAWLYGKTGQREKAEALFDEMEARSRLEFVTPFWLTVAAVAAGCPEEAEHFAKRAVVERDPLVVLGRTIPLWDGAREMPWFENVVEGVWA
jgi:eukaryotic-like serine/threonine-protein kinase